MKYNKLTANEENVIVHGGTEMPYSGEYDNFYETGTYVCRRCNAPLYRSENKFDAHCGWPAFDDEIPGAIKHGKDIGIFGEEISCENCNGHLGHVFRNEGFTKTNKRHCVNSLSMKFISENKK